MIGKETEQSDNISGHAGRLVRLFKKQFGEVDLIETHISWVFLTADHAYKIKKPIQNAFLDYSTIENRRKYCEEELRLDRRYAPNLYLHIASIVEDGDDLVLTREDSEATDGDYAVVMRRFPADDLLRTRLHSRCVSPAQLQQLAQELAEFHQSATCAPSDSPFAGAPQIYQDAIANFDALQAVNRDAEGLIPLDYHALVRLREWTEQTFESSEEIFRTRKNTAHVRECHGDLHTGNIVWWEGRFVPFDGIEFSPSLRWIDTISDVAFLAMDLLAEAEARLANLFTSHYLEASGDYQAIQLWRWYVVYRALVRAKVARLASEQHPYDSPEFTKAIDDCQRYVRVALESIEPPAPRLWITHGLSGSGKSTRAEQQVANTGAIRLRSDVERKRLDLHLTNSGATQDQARPLYSADETQRTYQRLVELTTQLLSNGFSVVVDATFLQFTHREHFRRLARKLQVPFGILACEAEPDELRRRITARLAEGTDPSDADLEILENQLQNHDPLRPEEKGMQ